MYSVTYSLVCGVGDAQLCGSNAFWPSRRDERSGVLIGPCALVGQMACRLLVCAREAIDRTHLVAIKAEPRNEKVE